MANSVPGKIKEALIARINLLSGNYSIEFPDTEFDPPNLDPNNSETIYLDVDIFSNSTESYSFGPNKGRYSGILQIAVMYPKLFGTIKATDLAGEIAEHFPLGLSMFQDDIKVFVSEEPSVITPIADGDKTRVAVSIPYRCCP